MSVEITIEPQVLNGLVAEETYLWHAAKRLGLRMPAECQGRGQCDGCAVTVTAGADLLSPPTIGEQTVLGDEKLAHGQRLACQVRAESAGAVTFSAVPRTVKEDPMRDFHKDFSNLSLTQKFAALARMEVVALNEALNSLLSVPSQLGAMGVDFLANKGRQARDAEGPAQEPSEHKETPPEDEPAQS